MKRSRISLESGMTVNPSQDQYNFRGRKCARRSQPPQGLVIKKNSLPGIIDGYQKLNVVGYGSYGKVYRAMDKKTGEIVAIKKESEGISKTTLIEIGILESVRGHPRFVQLKRVLKDNRRNKVYLVMEFLYSDLNGYIGGAAMDIRQVKKIMKQLLEGVSFLHDNRVMHRDIKPSNILISQESDVKICDFGLSRRFSIGTNVDEVYTPKMVTLYYRAPELLFGSSDYTCAVDMWSIGCIMGELLTKNVLFRGWSEMGQLRKILEILGMPENGCIQEICVTKFVKQPNNVLREKIANEGGSMLCDRGFDLLNGFLAYEPSKRLTAAEALNHSWFREDI